MSCGPLVQSLAYNVYLSTKSWKTAKAQKENSNAGQDSSHLFFVHPNQLDIECTCTRTILHPLSFFNYTHMLTNINICINYFCIDYPFGPKCLISVQINPSVPNVCSMACSTMVKLRTKHSLHIRFGMCNSFVEKQK